MTKLHLKSWKWQKYPLKTLKISKIPLKSLNDKNILTISKIPTKPITWIKYLPYLQNDQNYAETSKWNNNHNNK